MGALFGRLAIADDCVVQRMEGTRVKDSKDGVWRKRHFEVVELVVWCSVWMVLLGSLMTLSRFN